MACADQANPRSGQPGQAWQQQLWHCNYFNVQWCCNLAAIAMIYCRGPSRDLAHSPYPVCVELGLGSVCGETGEDLELDWTAPEEGLRQQWHELQKVLCEHAIHCVRKLAALAIRPGRFERSGGKLVLMRYNDQLNRHSPQRVHKIYLYPRNERGKTNTNRVGEL